MNLNERRRMMFESLSDEDLSDLERIFRKQSRTREKCDLLKESAGGLLVSLNLEQIDRASVNSRSGFKSAKALNERIREESLPC